VLTHDEISGERRLALLTALGEASSRYRETVYRNDGLSGKSGLAPERVRELLDDALAALDRSIGRGRREDGLYHAYNLLERRPDRIDTDNLYAMLEGQVAALSSGAIPPAEAVAVLESLFASDLFRPDQQSFMLYPDRRLPGFLEKNRIPAEAVASITLLRSLAASGNEQIVARDSDGCYRFNSDFRNARDLDAELGRLDPRYAAEAEAARETAQVAVRGGLRPPVLHGALGHDVRVRGPGLHLLAHGFEAAAGGTGGLLRRARPGCRRTDDPPDRRTLLSRAAGSAFNKTPAEYGAFPTDPYSHTPGHGGASQPGMTGRSRRKS